MLNAIWVCGLPFRKAWDVWDVGRMIVARCHNDSVERLYESHLVTCIGNDSAGAYPCFCDLCTTRRIPRCGSDGPLLLVRPLEHSIDSGVVGDSVVDTGMNCCILEVFQNFVVGREWWRVGFPLIDAQLEQFRWNIILQSFVARSIDGIRHPRMSWIMKKRRQYSPRR